MANYWYLDQLKEEGINLYVEPVSNDGGTALGAALLWHHRITNDVRIRERITDLYTGPEYNYTNEYITDMVETYDGEVRDATHEDIIKLVIDKNIVALFQGRSEAGTRALGNRTLLYDPRDPEGKDFVNTENIVNTLDHLQVLFSKNMCMTGLIFVVWMRLHS